MYVIQSVCSYMCVSVMQTLKKIIEERNYQRKYLLLFRFPSIYTVYVEYSAWITVSVYYKM